MICCPDPDDCHGQQGCAARLGCQALAQPYGKPRDEIAGGNFWLTNTVPPTVDLAAVRARAQQAQAARAQGRDDPKDPPDWRNLSPHGDSNAPGPWLHIIGVAALVVVICIAAGYAWQRWGGIALDIINRHAATLGLAG
jgi:hypothetical protein